MTKPKTAEQVNTPQTGALEIMKIKEAEASCRLDGDTMDCDKCRQQMHKEFCEEVEKLIQGEFKESPITFYGCSLIDVLRANARWQQFKEGK